MLYELEGELDLEEEAMELEPLFARRGRNAHAFFEAPTAGPVFDVTCPDGCPPFAAGQCRPVVRQAIIEAIKMANNAASKLEMAIKLKPKDRDKVAKETAGLFTAFFAHDPSLPVTWAGNKESGASVVKRFRAVARELGGGRRIVFRCDPHCDPEHPNTAMCGTAVAVTEQARLRNVICLCAPFWSPPTGLRGLPPENYRAGTIIHEMLHMLFTDFFHHVPNAFGDPEFRRDNANCYEAFAYRVDGFGADPAAVALCIGRPA